MLSRDEILKFLSSNKEHFRQEFQVTKLGIFGSFAVGTQNESSDLDVIVEFEQSTPNLYDKKNRIREILRQRFGREIDLCREKYIRPYFRSQIMSTAIYV